LAATSTCPLPNRAAGTPANVPVSVAGSRHVMTKGQLMVHPGDVRVTIHEPIPTAGVTRREIIEFGNHVRDVVRSAVDEPATT